jgi:hypothetical protein
MYISIGLFSFDGRLRVVFLVVPFLGCEESLTGLDDISSTGLALTITGESVEARDGGECTKT